MDILPQSPPAGDSPLPDCQSDTILAIAPTLAHESAADGSIALSPLGINYGLSRSFLEKGLISRQDLFQAAKILLPKENRLQKCFAVKADSLSPVWGQYAANVDRARLTNFCLCHNPYMCPNCGPRVAEAKKLIAQTDLAVWFAEGYTAAAVILTLQHLGYEALAAVHSRLIKAMKSMLNSRAGRKFVQKWRIVGRLVSPDYTYGKNGHHPHRNLILFLERNHLTVDEVSEFITELKGLWVKFCEKAGGYADLEHGCVVSFDRVFDFTDYMTSKAAGCGYGGTDSRKDKGNSKWGIADELTKHEFKTRSKGFTPTDLLRLYLTHDTEAALLIAEGEETLAQQHQTWADKIGAIFVEYAQVFKGKHFLETQPRRPNFRQWLNELKCKYVNLVVSIYGDKPQWTDIFRLTDEANCQIVMLQIQNLVKITLRETKGDPAKMREFFGEWGVTEGVYFPALDPEPEDIAAVRRLNAFAAEWNEAIDNRAQGVLRLGL